MSRLDDVIAEINTETDLIAGQLDKLRSDLASGDNSAADKLGPVAERLRSLAADPANPVPVPPADQPV